MDYESKKMIVKTVAGFIIFLVIGYFLLNGFGGYPYKQEELEETFLTRVKNMQALTEEEEPYELVQLVHNNSVSFLLQTEAGERACATYVRNVFLEKYKEASFYSGKTGVLYQDTFSYRVNDNIMTFDLTFTFGDAPAIVPGENGAPIMYYKYLGVCIAAMGFFGARIFGKRNRR